MLDICQGFSLVQVGPMGTNNLSYTQRAIDTVFESDTDTLTSILSLILLGIIAIILLLILSPQLKHLLNNTPEEKPDPHGDSDQYPLRKIFLEYKHGTVNDWINWIKNQDNERKDLAFNNLIRYLDGKPEEIGVLVSEVLKATIAFKYPEGFPAIQRLVESVRNHWGAYTIAEQFYEQAMLGLVELDTGSAQTVLATEFEHIKAKHDATPFMLAIVNALNHLPDNEDLNDFYFEILRDPHCELSIKEHLLDLLQYKPIETRVTVAATYFKFWNKSEIKKLADNDTKIIEKAFVTNQDLIINENYELWDLVLKGTEHKLTDKLFTNHLSSLLSNPAIEISQPLLLHLFSANGILRSDFLSALAKRHKLSDEELELANEQYEIEMKRSSDIVNIKKFSHKKDPPNMLEEAYKNLNKSLSLDMEFKNQNLNLLNFLLGYSLNDKKYLIESVASNHDCKILNINLVELLGSVTELAKFKAVINQSKPCIVYFYGLDQVINREWNDLVMSNLDSLNHLFKEFKLSAGVNFLISLEIGGEDLANNNQLKEILKNMFKVSYGALPDINKPDLLSRQKILNDYIKQVATYRVKSTNGLELIAKQAEGYSLVEYLAYINNYLKLCLLVYGELIPPDQLDIPVMNLNDEAGIQRDKDPV